MRLACAAVLLDMDGTLVDSRALVERMWILWADEHGIPRDTILAVAHGRRTYETMRMVAPEIATPEMAAALDAREAEHEDETTVVPGAIELVQALPRDRWAVVTSAVRDIARRRIVGVGLPDPPLLVGAEDVVQGKPAPDGYLLAAARMGVDPARCVVVEDTPAGIAAARAAGATVVGLRTTYASIDGCDAVVNDLRELRVERAGPEGVVLRVG